MLFIDEAKIQVNKDTAIFITLNPHLSGRNQLPLNLRSLFRPISMVAPDSRVIAEILLFSAGFTSAESLGKKVVAVHDAMHSITNDYWRNDFGLRSIKATI
jgi:hypothetical protein